MRSMKLSPYLWFSLSFLLTSVIVMQGQVAQPRSEQRATVSRSTAPVAAAPAVVAALPVSMRDVTIKKDPKGTWRCLHGGVQACTNSEVQAAVTAVRAKSTDKQFTASPDGAITCKTSSGQACTDSEMLDAAVKAGYNLKENVK